MRLPRLLILVSIITVVHAGIIVLSKLPKQREPDQIHGEIIVRSGPLYIKGPPKGFPLIRKQRSTNEVITTEARKKGSGGMKGLKKMWPYLFVPVMMSMGYAPFVLSSLKMFVMKAMWINMMALNAAIFMTLRNMVFGPRVGQHIKYYNVGYRKKPKLHYLDKHQWHR